jgi:hypothetical protein
MGDEEVDGKIILKKDRNITEGYFLNAAGFE